MSKILFLSIALVSSITFVNAQNVLRNDTLYFSNGGFLAKNQKILLGKGINGNGNFKNIEVNANHIVRNRATVKTNLSIEDFALSSQFNFKESRIIRIIDRGNRKEGKKYFAIIGVGAIKRYQVSIDQAVKDGEIVLTANQMYPLNAPKNTLSYSNN